ncbi:MAG: hypothetical protein EBX41_09575 [Chitinophagia bacterium]|nr:hypothetical protein [Chitinophagia bacterium]
MIRYTRFYLLLLFIAVASCTKSAPPSQNGIAAILRTGKWKVGAGTIRLKLPNGKDTILKYTDFRIACVQDDCIKFDSLNRGAVFTNAVKCNGAEADSMGFTWDLRNEGKLISIYGGFHLTDSLSQSIVTDASSGSTVYQIKYAPAVSSAFNIINATIDPYDKTSFTLSYYMPAQRLDTTGGHQASPLTIPDTFYFNITYTNY